MVWQCLAAFMLCNLPFYMFVPSQDMEDMFSHSGSLPLNILGLGRRVDHGWPMSPRPPEVNTCPAFIFFFCKSLRFTCSSRERFLRKQWMLGMKMENLGITLPKWSEWGEQCSFLRILRVNIPCSADFQKKKHMLFHVVSYVSQMKLNITCVLQVSMIEQKGCRGPAPWSSAEPPDRQPDRVGRVCAFFFESQWLCLYKMYSTNIKRQYHQWSSMISGWHLQSFTKPLKSHGISFKGSTTLWVRPTSTLGRSLKPSICFALLAGLGSWAALCDGFFRTESCGLNNPKIFWEIQLKISKNVLSCAVPYTPRTSGHKKIYSNIYGKIHQMFCNCNQFHSGQLPLFSHTLCCWSMLKSANIDWGANRNLLTPATKELRMTLAGRSRGGG